MEIFRYQNIKLLCDAMVQDEYDDTEQDRKEERYQKQRDFILRNIEGCKTVLDVGCGTGGSFKWYPITHALEPGLGRLKIIKRIKYIRAVVTYDGKSWKSNKSKKIQVKQGFCEALPWGKKMFDAVMALGVWEHVRSDFECLIEVNRVLKMDCKFLLTLVTRSPAGRVFDPRAYFRTVEDFGFDTVEKRYIHIKDDWGFTAYAFQKIREFNPDWLRKLQLIKDEYGKWKDVRNFVFERDKYLL